MRNIFIGKRRVKKNRVIFYNCDKFYGIGKFLSINKVYESFKEDIVNIFKFKVKKYSV